MALEENQQQINLDTTFAGKVDFLQGVSFDNDVVLGRAYLLMEI